MGVPTLFCLLGILSCSVFLGVNATCNTGWHSFMNYCYLYVDKSETWENAEDYCRSEGKSVHLASISTEEETHLLSSFIREKQIGQNSVWIGLVDENHSGKWEWNDKDTKFDYKAWKTGQPDNSGGNAFCVELTRDSGYKEWNDVSCETLNSFVCKKTE